MPEECVEVARFRPSAHAGAAHVLRDWHTTPTKHAPERAPEALDLGP
jgi:hypothetical protein